MRAIVVGMGVQGEKRKKYLGKDFVFSVDKFKNANYKSIFDVPLKAYNAALICVPESEKIDLIKYCIKNKKNILVEKPLLIKSDKLLTKFEKQAKKNKVILYTAYNHRFEPNILKLKNLIEKKTLGKIYKCKIFYGNGTSYLVKKSKWRDKELGVVTDIGSHLLDLCLFWFGNRIKKLKIIEINKFENKAPDHAIISLEINKIKIQLEMTLCMWKNTFTCDLLAAKGSAHLNSLCKWSKNTFTYRKRKLPSGRPIEKITSFKQGDPTWRSEYLFFKDLIKKNKKNNLKRDIILNKEFAKIKKYNFI
jgi:scyllo-inositol 2-dehydrogenase (NADP+)